jgi:hypothetical protein
MENKYLKTSLIVSIAIWICLLNTLSAIWVKIGAKSTNTTCFCTADGKSARYWNKKDM